MRTHSLISVFFLGLVAPALGGCSSGSTDLAMEDMPQALADALCTQVRECAETRAHGDLDYRLVLSESFTTRCPEILGISPGRMEYLMTAVDAGRITYDASAARRCVSDISASCTIDGGFEFLPSCRDALRGNVALGDACTFTEECASGSRCNATLTNDVCDGTCVARLPVGALCDQTDECAVPDGTGDAECSRNGGADRVCVAVARSLGAREGEPCGEVVDTGLERASVACAGALFCTRADRDGVGVCTRPIADGQPCAEGQACEQGSLCVSNGAMNTTCTRVTIRSNAGDTCDDDAVFCDFVAGLNCVAGKCEALPAGGCEANFHCESGEYCDDDSETCQARKPLNATCQNPDQCVSGTCSPDASMPGPWRCVEPAPRCG